MIELTIRKELFWDANLEMLDQEKNKSLIIERVLSYGNLPEIKVIFQYYGKDIITAVVKRLGYLDPKTFAFVVGYLGIRKEEMKCFTKKLSNPQHWN